jgi:hypothetical protein
MHTPSRNSDPKPLKWTPTRCLRRVFLLRRTFVGTLATLLLASTGARAEERLPPQVQVILFKKIFVYNPSVQSRLKILVVRSEGASAETDEMARSFLEAGMAVSVSKVSDLPSQLANCSVVYLSAELSPSHRDLILQSKVLSISGTPAMADQGEATVAVGMRSDGRPQIIVNLRRLKAEGQTFSSDLLRVARVVQ